MEHRFGHDFSRVSIHADHRAAASAQAVNALAYTVGRHVVFAPGQYQPTTDSGRNLLAHELAHTIQQDATDGHPLDRLSISDPAGPAEHAADRAASAALAGSPSMASNPSLEKSHSPIIARRTPPLDGGPQDDNTDRDVGPVPAATPASAAPAEPDQLNDQSDRLIASFDSDAPSKRPWKLNELTKTIVTALSASNLAYVRIFGVYPTKAGEEDPKSAAFQRAETVRKALIQWIGPGKFSEDRFDVAFADGSIGDPQIQIYIAYNPTVVSGPGISSGTAPKAPEPAPPDSTPPDKSDKPADPNAPSSQIGGQAAVGYVSHHYTTPAGPNDALHEWLVQAMLGYTRQLHGKNLSGPELQGFGQVQYSLTTKQFTIGVGGQVSYVLALPANLQLSFWGQLTGNVNPASGVKQLSPTVGTQLQWQPVDFFAIGAQAGVGPNYQTSGPNSTDRGVTFFIQITK
jgi:hypothetical protein